MNFLTCNVSYLFSFLILISLFIVYAVKSAPFGIENLGGSGTTWV